MEWWGESEQYLWYHYFKDTPLRLTLPHKSQDFTRGDRLLFSSMWKPFTQQKNLTIARKLQRVDGTQIFSVSSLRGRELSHSAGSVKGSELLSVWHFLESILVSYRSHWGRKVGHVLSYKPVCLSVLGQVFATSSMLPPGPSHLSLLGRCLASDSGMASGPLFFCVCPPWGRCLSSLEPPLQA